MLATTSRRQRGGAQAVLLAYDAGVVLLLLPSSPPREECAADAAFPFAAAAAWAKMSPCCALCNLQARQKKNDPAAESVPLRSSARPEDRLAAPRWPCPLGGNSAWGLGLVVLAHRYSGSAAHRS